MTRSGLRRIIVLTSLSLGCSLPGCEKSDSSAPVAQSASEASKTPSTAAPVVATPSREGWPGEDDVKAAILKIEHDIWASEHNKSIWHVKEMRHEVKSVQLAQQATQKQMTYGAQAITVYPAKVLYTRITEYTDKPEVREDQGQDGVWFLYRDSFGNWTGKYGKE